MIGTNYKKIIRVIIIALTLSGFSAFATAEVWAQTNIAIPVDGGDPDIDITALVRGCGNGVIEPDLGEQCEGPRNNLTLDLGGNSCVSVGFKKGGTLGCRNSCVFETSNCNKTSRGIKRDRSDFFESENIPDTNIVFTGQGEPGSTFFVLNENEYITSIIIGNDGFFSTTVSDPNPGNYNFTFYTLSENGLFGPRDFSTYISPNTTTYINNIFIAFAIPEIIIDPLVTIPETLTADNIETNQENDSLSESDFPLKTDVLTKSLDELSQNENLSSQDIQRLVSDFSEQNGYAIEVPKSSQGNWKQAQNWLSEKTNGLSEWYPNVYVSFMVPYWEISYDITHWFNKYEDPFNFHLFARDWSW